ncbi:MAG: hypothetical protein AAFQ87_07200, partial [Bacteroidota bacterium]
MANLSTILYNFSKARNGGDGLAQEISMTGRKFDVKNFATQIDGVLITHHAAAVINTRTDSEIKSILGLIRSIQLKAILTEPTINSEKLIIEQAEMNNVEVFYSRKGVTIFVLNVKIGSNSSDDLPYR